MKSDSRHIAIEAIKKKLLGKTLSYREIFSIMDEISHERLGDVLTTYFAAAGFTEGFSTDELYYMTKAMVSTGEKLHFDGIVADKHSTGGVAGTRTTMILVPIIAASGFTIPKNSTRAITSPSGTADSMEVLAPVTFSIKQIEAIVHKIGGCIVWGGHLGLAPADDVIIQIEQPIAFESYDKIIVAVMAKKIASGATHVVFDVPVGPTMKIQHFRDAEIIAKKFAFLAKKFHITVVTDINETRQNAGRGVGPVLEAKDVLQVLEQKKERSLALEAKALRLSGKLFDICLADQTKRLSQTGEELAKEILYSGKAHAKMREIIKTQGGDPDIESTKLRAGTHQKEVVARKSGRVTSIDNRQISIICRILGCPTDKRAGLYTNRRLEDQVDKNDILYTLYSSDKWRLAEAVETLNHVPIYTVS
ncbi:thymidine phosphorylase [Patescibacteria group bacterium]|nr:thymidine phosphorylase [Patescibacteria group bacterium]